MMQVLSGRTIICGRCEEEVLVPASLLTPTIPPMLPDLPAPILMREIGHECDPQLVESSVMAAYARAGRG